MTQTNRLTCKADNMLNTITKLTMDNVLELAHVSCDTSVDQSEYVEKKLFAMYKQYQKNNPLRREDPKKPFFYSPYTTICQSSGYGKSRTIELMAKDSSKFYIHYCCFRETMHSGFPRKSVYADKLMSASTWRDAEHIVKVYLSALLNSITPELDTEEFYNRFSRMSDESEKYQKELNDKISIGASVNWPQRLPKPLLVVFDEAKILIDRTFNVQNQTNRQRPEPSNLFLAIVRCLQEIPSSLIFALFIGTDSKVFDLMPSSHIDTSSRVASRGSILFPPIYMLPTFDAYRRRRPMDTNIDGLLSAVQFKNICSFGRPLWASLINARDKIIQRVGSSEYSNAMTNDRYLLEMAACKLTGGRPLLKSTVEFNIENVLSIMSVRVGTIQPLHTTTAENLVSTYMATLMSVNKERNMIDISYPSEPVLALAASQYYWNSFTLVSSLCSSLATYIQSNLLDKGSIEELVVKIALLHAFDKSCPHKKDANTYYDNKSSKVSQKYLRVKDFLTSLLGKKVIRQIYEQMEPEQANKLLNGYVSFNHFFKAVHREFQLDDMKTLMRRGAAGESKKNNQLADLKIPIGFELNSFDKMSSIQIKLHEVEEKPSYEQVQQINLKECLGCDDDSVPSLTIYIHLHSHNEQITTLIENDEKKISNTACLYVAGIDSFNFDDTVNDALRSLCGSLENDLDFEESLTNKFGFDVLESASIENNMCSMK